MEDEAGICGCDDGGESVKIALEGGASDENSPPLLEVLGAFDNRSVSSGERVPASRFRVVFEGLPSSATHASRLAASIPSARRTNARTVGSSPAPLACSNAWLTRDLASQNACMTRACALLPSRIPCALASADMVVKRPSRTLSSSCRVGKAPGRPDRILAVASDASNA